MASSPAEVTLELTPSHRVDVIDVNDRIREAHGDLLAPFRHALYCSFHTTAGYFEQRLAERLGHDATNVEAFLQSFQQLFPAGADYRHDNMAERDELTEEQKLNEPRNGDSHLTFIGSGLESCTTYSAATRPLGDRPVYFVDLDGVNVACDGSARSRRTTVVGFNDQRIARRLTLEVPVSSHPIESVNLREARLGLLAAIEDELRRLGLRHGRVDLTLPADELHAGLTVNEFETLLMQHDLAEVIRNPMRFMAEKAGNMLRDPRAIPAKAKNYAKYDLVQFINRALDKLHLEESLVERVVDKFLRMPASRFLRMKRNVSLLVAEQDGRARLQHGRYQSPILVQWQKPRAGTVRKLQATIVAFE